MDFTGDSKIDLASKMNTIILLSEDQRKLIEVKGRLKIKQEFFEKIVIKKYE